MVNLVSMFVTVDVRVIVVLETSTMVITTTKVGMQEYLFLHVCEHIATDAKSRSNLWSVPTLSLFLIIFDSFVYL